MDAAAVKAKVKQVIANITEIDPEDIDDNASFVEDLQLDSLSLLEIGVDVDYTFKLGAPEERLQQLKTVQDSVDMVMEYLANKPSRAEVA